MRVRIGDLPPGGLAVGESLPLAPLNGRLAAGPGGPEGSRTSGPSGESGLDFRAAPAVEVVVAPKPYGAEVKGTVTGRLRQNCARCDVPIERDLTARVDHVFKRTDPGAKKPEDDVGVTYYEGDHIELGDVLEEYLILQISPFWAPPETPSGCCGRCGRAAPTPTDADAGRAVTLGDLLRPLTGRSE